MSAYAVDHVLFGVYMLGVLALGVWLTRYVKTSGDYFLAGRRLPFWAIGMSIVVSDIGAMDMIAHAGGGFRYGIALAHWDWIGSFAAMVIAAFVFVPFYWRTRVFTVAEFLGRRYHAGVRALHSAIWIAILTFNIGIAFHASAALLGELLGWGYWTSVLSVAGVVGVYMVGAGLSAVVLTDVVQMIVMFVGGFAVVALGLWHVGGPAGLVDALERAGHADRLRFYLPPDGSTPYPWTGILFGLGLVMSTAYFAGNQTIVQRCLAARSEWDAKASMMLGAFLKALIPPLVVTPGLIALVLFEDRIPLDALGQPRTERAYPVLIKNLLPPGMLGLMFAAFLAALMSSMDSILNAVSTLFTKDVYQAFLRRGASDRELLRTGRVVTAAVLAISVATAPMSERFAGVYQFMQTLLSIVAGPTLAILVLGMLWAGCTPWGGFFGLLVGCGFAFVAGLDSVAGRLFSIEDPFLYVSFWSFLLAGIVAAVVSLWTRPAERERIEPLLWNTARRAAVQEALRRRAQGGDRGRP